MYIPHHFSHDQELQRILVLLPHPIKIKTIKAVKVVRVLALPPVYLVVTHLLLLPIVVILIIVL
jgi:hypothetical protein